MIKANIVQHSKGSESDTEIITFSIELHRFILPEFLTHKHFSRNFQSSRAIPSWTQAKMILKDPALPVYWGLNNPGMQSFTKAGYIRTKLANGVRRTASMFAIMFSLIESKVLGIHKQWTNRLLEPFMYTTGCFTTNKEGLSNFLSLRLAPDAQPEIKALAEAVHEEYKSSVPKALKPGEYHLPFVTNKERKALPTKECIKISAARAAAQSYRNTDPNVEKVWSMLNLSGGEGNIHASPAEHQAMYDPKAPAEYNGNLGKGWIQHRKLIKGEFKPDFLGTQEE